MDEPIRVIDAATGRVRWSADGPVLAATDGSVITITRDSPGRILTWRNPASGSVEATRSFGHVKNRVASGTRLVCAMDGEVVSVVPEP